MIVEDAMGHIAFTVLYLLSGIAGSVLSFAGMIKQMIMQLQQERQGLFLVL